LATKIRLARVGVKNNPKYRIVVADSKMPRDGRAIEVVGNYCPGKSDYLEVNEEKIKEWISKGAQITDSVKNLLKKKGVKIN
jgi:small subunit ribosomal protein S16